MRHSGLSAVGSSADADIAGKIFKLSLTAPDRLRLDLTARLQFAHSPRVNGLNHICGICREIIR
jgi:hypothetical protein